MPVFITGALLTTANTKVEAAQVSDRWMDKQNVVHPYNGISFRRKKEWTIPCENIPYTNKYQRGSEALSISNR